MDKYTITYKTADGKNTWVRRDTADAAMMHIQQLARQGCTDIMLYQPGTGNRVVQHP